MAAQPKNKLVLMAQAELDDTLNRDLNQVPPLDYDSFYSFVKARYAAELVDFYVEVQAFEILSEKDRIKIANTLVDDYVRDNSPRQINLSCSLRQLIEDTTTSTSFRLELFLDAKHEVKSLIETGHWYKYIEQKTLKTRLAMARGMAFDWIKDPGKIVNGGIFVFPSPINKLDSRMHSFFTATLVSLLLILKYYTAVDPRILGLIIMIGFFSRVCFGPRLDLQAWMVLFVVRPLLEDILQLPCIKSSFVAGPPYRFAQFCGLVFSFVGLILNWIAIVREDQCYEEIYSNTTDDFTYNAPSLDSNACIQYETLSYASDVVYGLLLFLTALAGAFGFCAGCFVFHCMMKIGMVPHSVCDECDRQFINNRTNLKKDRNIRLLSVPRGGKRKKTAPPPTPQGNTTSLPEGNNKLVAQV